MTTYSQVSLHHDFCVQDSQAHGQRTLSTVRSGQLRFLSESEVESLHGTSQRGTEHSADPILNW